MLLLQCYIIRVNAGSYLLPASLFSFAWFLFSIVPLVVLFNVPINPLSALFIVGCIFAFSLSSIPFNWQYVLEKNAEKATTLLPTLNSKVIKAAFYSSILGSCIFSVLLVLQNGFDLQGFVTDFIATSARYAALRGNEYLEYGVFGTLSIFFTYFSAALGGVLTFFKKGGKMGMFFVSICPSLFAMLTQSSKLIFFVAVVFYMATTLLLKIFSDQRFIFNAKDLKKLLVLGIIILPLLTIAFISRDGYNNFNNSSEAADLLLPAVYSYFFGSYYAFADFISFYWGMPSVSLYKVEHYNLGYDSFKGIYDMLGGTKIYPAGFYNDFYMYKNLLATNIYSFFRGAVQDFGCIGTIVLMYIFGLLSHFFFYRLLIKSKPFFEAAIFIIFFAFVGLSFLINIFTARYVFLIAFAFFALCHINSYLTSKYSNLLIK